jgi:tetratricopeptide (TPR) repeat protein
MAKLFPIPAVIALCVPIASSGRVQRAKSVVPAAVVDAMRQYREGDYAQASVRFEQAYSEALARADYPLAISILNNLASCRMLAFQYRAAMRSLLESRDLAIQINDLDRQRFINLNLAQLYALMGDYPRAIEAATPVAGARRRCSPSPAPRHSRGKAWR